MSFVSQGKTVTTRKPHRCHVCGQKMPVGENCISVSGANEDGVWRIYMHPECREFTREWSDDEWEIYYPGDVERPKKETP